MGLFSGWVTSPRHAAARDTRGAFPRITRNRNGWLTHTRYVLPKQVSEERRLDFQHELFRRATIDRNHPNGQLIFAPILTPQDVLDVGCGTGIWADQIAELFPHSTIRGIDIDASPFTRTIDKRHPANFFFHEADALGPLPFADQTFDLISMRLAGTWIPSSAWTKVLSELYRITRVGGWLQIIDCGVPQGGGPAFARLTSWFCQVMESRNLIAGVGTQLEAFLAGTAYNRQERRIISIGTQPRIMPILASNLLAAYQAIMPLLIERRMVIAEDYSYLLAQAREELTSYAVRWPIFVVCGSRQ